jgi:hypothetical protein
MFSLRKFPVEKFKGNLNMVVRFQSKQKNSHRDLQDRVGEDGLK